MPLTVNLTHFTLSNLAVHNSEVEAKVFNVSFIMLEREQVSGGDSHQHVRRVSSKKGCFPWLTLIIFLPQLYVPVELWIQ